MSGIEIDVEYNNFKNYPNFKVCFMYERSFYSPLLISVSAESGKNSLEAFFQFYSVWRYYLYEFSANISPTSYPKLPEG